MIEAASRRSAPRRVARLGVALCLVVAASLAMLPAWAAAADEQTSGAEPDLALLEEAIGIIQERFVDPEVISAENLTSGAIRGMVEALGDDGHTVYLTAAQLQAERDALQGRVTGIGVIIDQRSGTPRVIAVVDGSPADRVGLQPGDLIVAVDGNDVSRIPVADVADLVRGSADTQVRLVIERPGVPEAVEYSIVRRSVAVEPASWAFIPASDIAVVRIVQFSAQAGQEARQAVEAVVDLGASGIVLDLRGNPGGIVSEALDVAGLFVSDGVAYLEQGRDGMPIPVAVGAGSVLAPDLPLVVLVDYGTASSAEILAAALRDNGRARIVGEQTFGTGTVLNTFGLSDGSALRIGVSKWLTPNGADVFRVGVQPDDVVELPTGVLALDPGDLVGMTAPELEQSGDLPLLRALESLGA